MKSKPPHLPSKQEDTPKSRGNYVDVFVKRMFSRILVFSDFLMYYADPGFVAEINLAKIEPAPTHYIGKTGDERIADLVFQCPLKDGKGTVMAVIVFEHQSGSLKKIPRKLLRYISAIWDTETKDGKKILSAPYFIVLRTARKPYRGQYPRMSDSLPKGRDGKPLGKTVEIEYDVVDLPAWDYNQLAGGAVLRLALGILKKMLEGRKDEFAEAILPLREISDQEQKIELSNELLQFVDKALRVHNRRVDEAMMKKALKPVFQDEVDTMIKSIFEEKFDEGKIEGKIEGEAKMLAKYLNTRFKRLPKTLSNRLLAINDTVVLESLMESAVKCESLKEFEKALR
ncbi:MAG: Rpn family recombination-promoting nuclease/putative transposase [Planctomycetaceae bacterium]|nr:Rpn family recombination-promoting nuclease/putative transposase [Planctomycetaceae bacterium]